MSINFKLGDPDQNSYIAVSQAEEYFDTRYLSTAWENLNTTEKEKLLIGAARDFENFNYIEDQYYDTQGLSFPLSTHEVITGNCASPITNSSFYHSNLKSTSYNVMPTNYWKYGTIHMTSATLEGETRSIASSLDGIVYTASSFTSTPTENTSFVVFAPVDKDIRNAQCEQAFFTLKNSNLEVITGYKSLGAENVRIGDASVNFSSGATNKTLLISPNAKRLLGRWISRMLRTSRF